MKDTQTRAEELSLKYGVKVVPIVFQDDEASEEIVGFIQEPSRLVKLRILDKMVSSPASASAELFEIILIKEESDPRFYSENPKDDKYFIGGAMEAMQMVSVAQNLFKKK